MSYLSSAIAVLLEEGLPCGSVLTRKLAERSRSVDERVARLHWRPENKHQPKKERTNLDMLRDLPKQPRRMRKASLLLRFLDASGST